MNNRFLKLVLLSNLVAFFGSAELFKSPTEQAPSPGVKPGIIKPNPALTKEGVDVSDPVNVRIEKELARDKLLEILLRNPEKTFAFTNDYARTIDTRLMMGILMLKEGAIPLNKKIAWGTNIVFRREINKEKLLWQKYLLARSARDKESQEANHTANTLIEHWSELALISTLNMDRTGLPEGVAIDTLLDNSSGATTVSDSEAEKIITAITNLRKSVMAKLATLSDREEIWALKESMENTQWAAELYIDKLDKTRSDRSNAFLATNYSDGTNLNNRIHKALAEVAVAIDTKLGIRYCAGFTMNAKLAALKLKTAKGPAKKPALLNVK